MKYSTLVERWLSPQDPIPKPIQPVIDALLSRGVNVCRAGVENPKAPTVYIFVDQPFDAPTILANLADKSGLCVAPDGSGINSREYIWIGFEADVCQFG